MVRVQKADVCPTLTANMGGGGHNVPFYRSKYGIRKLTETECLRLQGFPSSFIWPNILSKDRYRLIGNAVSPPIAKIISEHVRYILSEKVYLRKV